MAGRSGNGHIVMLVKWYANTFRGDVFADALGEIAPVATRYGALAYHVYRSNDDRYSFWQWSVMPDKISWERYWYGEEFQRWRAERASWYQVPVIYTPCEEVVAGGLEVEAADAAEAELGA